MEFGFVILHYMAYDMTIECVNNLLEKFGKNNIHIVIVDNGSANDTGVEIKNYYRENKLINVVINDSNLGFAKGNNVGFNYLKNNYNCDFIIIMNNDVLINQLDFLEKINLVYEETKFSVCGPDIYSPKADVHQNPVYKNDFLYGQTYENVKKINSQLKSVYKKRFLLQLKHVLFHWVRKIIPYKVEEKKVSDKYMEILDNVTVFNCVLHGACYIFSKNFINFRENAFNPGTFLYFEEDILHYECKRDNLLMIYDKRLKVDHLEDVTTDFVLNNDFKKNNFKNKNLIQSTQLYLDLLENC